MRSCSSQRHEVNIGTPEEESHGKINGTSCQNSLVFMSECTSAQALAVVHNTTGRGVLRQPLTFCITLLFLWRPPSQTMVAPRYFLWFHLACPKKTKTSKHNAKLEEFYLHCPRICARAWTMHAQPSLNPGSRERLMNQSKALKKPGPSLTFVTKLQTWAVWGCLFQTFQTVPVTSSGEETPVNGSSLSEKSHYPLFSFNPLGNSFLLKKTQLWFVCHTPWLKNSFIVHWEFLLSGNISYIKDHLEFSLGHSTRSKINSWKKVTKS